ncbi:nitrilase-related carbon-nitrogen hydrolase [Cecembia sp.]|uniref:nitrilase-related carbon-nitrogen hydrolase n=1 Tax=Cecembia sp. TaxID=1898110 RepID=UPI0025C4A17C|nr:nitrilase-related carbon-nitrogen hydrolase [Cecembia sp.]
MKKFVILILSVFVIWAIWANTESWSTLPEMAPNISHVENLIPLPIDSLQGNVVGIQPYMLESDYLSETRFFQKLEAYYQKAKEEGYLSSNTIVLLPEYLGTWLVILDEKPSVAKASSLTWAMAQLVLTNPFEFIKHYPLSKNEEDRIASTLFRMKANQMAKAYERSFLTLSKKYQVFTAAGSINLPEPQVIDNQIIVKKEAPLYNSSFLFGPDGSIYPTVIKKAFPIDSEKPFIAASSPAAIPSFELPMGKVGILVCADSWYPEAYEAIKGVDLVLVNSYCAVDGAMDVPWAGYNGTPAPHDVSLNDIGKISEQEAWKKYALPGRLGLSGAKHGVNVFLRGELWDLGTDGQPFFIRKGTLLLSQAAEKGGIWNMDY